MLKPIQESFEDFGSLSDTVLVMVYPKLLHPQT
jgi:hypothetical protein